MTHPILEKIALALGITTKKRRAELDEAERIAFQEFIKEENSTK
jgi:hypothetical protein